ncbi:MAG TPA: glycosyltransferase [Kiritimatiellia bacterium]|nr:glycosyltransferase [Kiritimatiellia bacterium]
MNEPSSKQAAPTPLPRTAVIIPFPRWDDWTAECLAACAALDHPELELWLLPDAELPTEIAVSAQQLAGTRALRIVPTGPGNPAMKRNVAMRATTCAWAALVDADAYPRPDWLQSAFREAKDTVGIVAGPNITPPRDSYARRLPGVVMRSPLGFGPGYVRHHPVPRHEPEEMPTCNMLIRLLPGLLFREEFSTAEDMMYCRDVRERGFRIVYSPDVVVFHHRRRFPAGFARQFYFYGRDKGRLFARGSRASRLPHAAPAAVLLYAVVYAVLAVLSAWICVPKWLALPGLAYLLLVVMESFRCSRNPLLALGGLVAFPVAHASYGLGWWRGLPTGWRERKQGAKD